MRLMKMAAEADDRMILSADTIDIFFTITQTGTISLGTDGKLASGPANTLRLELAPTKREGITIPISALSRRPPEQVIDADGH